VDSTVRKPTLELHTTLNGSISLVYNQKQVFSAIISLMVCHLEEQEMNQDSGTNHQFQVRQLADL